MAPRTHIRADRIAYLLRIDAAIWRPIRDIAARERITIARLIAAILSDAIRRDAEAIRSGERIEWRAMHGDGDGERLPYRTRARR
jgi:predicted DNA-binding ribbon-helix-helix protein